MPFGLASPKTVTLAWCTGFGFEFADDIACVRRLCPAGLCYYLPVFDPPRLLKHLPTHPYDQNFQIVGMVGKSKGKQKPLQATEVSLAKTAAENAKALEITQRLRKGRNLEPLLKEAEKLAENHSSAISQLCHAKVALAQAVEGIMTTSLTETETRPAIHERQKTLLEDALKAAREGALHHSSILCGRFYYRLAEVLIPNFEGLPWPPRVDGLTDPQTELLEQVH